WNRRFHPSAKPSRLESKSSQSDNRSIRTRWQRLLHPKIRLDTNWNYDLKTMLLRAVIATALNFICSMPLIFLTIIYFKLCQRYSSLLPSFIMGARSDELIGVMLAAIACLSLTCGYMAELWYLR